MNQQKVNQKQSKQNQNNNGRGERRDDNNGRGGKRNDNNDNDYTDDGPQRRTKTPNIHRYLKTYLEGDERSHSASERFLSCLIDGKYDASSQLLQVTIDEKSLVRFRQSFMDLESNDYFFKVLNFLSSPKLSFGSSKTCVSQCLEEIYSSRFLERINLQTITHDNHQVLLAGFILNIMTTLTTAREDRFILRFAQQLKRIQPGLEMFLDAPTSFTHQNISLFQQIHDNDFPFDFRRVQIIPSTEEIITSVDMVSLIDARLNCRYPSASVSRTIEFQFRLLRENWVQKLREEYIEEKTKNDFFTSRRMYSNPILIGFNSSKYCDKLYAEVLLTPNPAILTIMKDHQNKLEDYFLSKSGSRILPINSSIFLLNNEGIIVAVGTIVSRDVDEVFIKNFKQNNSLKIGLSFPSNVFKSLLKSSINLPKITSNNQTNEIQIPLSCYLYSSSVVSFVIPILSHLKTMITIPFEEEIIQGQPSAPLTNPLNFSQMMQNITNNGDQSQIEALRQSCSHRFNLIQGPPGTGKTYIGVKLANYLLKSTNHKILTLSYTNHALDSFMESIMDSDNLFEGLIKRLGRSPKTSSRMKEHTIGSGKFNYHQLMCSRQLKEEFGNQMKELNKTMNDYHKSRSWDEKSWNFVKFYLSEFSDIDYSNQFSIPNGINIVGRNGKPMKSNHLFKSWYYGDPIPVNLKHYINDTNVWVLNRNDRRNLLQKWNNEYLEILFDDFNDIYQTCERISSQISSLNSETKIQELIETRLLGSTTSSAAMSSDLIIQYQPTVLIIEEAAEILEAHILVNISSSVKHVILIGDHKQLRPKVDLYSLQKASNRGINFDVSLFERLACNNRFKLTTLSVQHRMRPEISEIIRRSTYPELKDHNSTLRRSSILGLQSNIIFINHNNFEKSKNDVLEKVAKVNEYEAKMVVKTVHYLLSQGYQCSDIVILTPYLGQLFCIHELLSQENMKAQISKMDAEDLDNNGFDGIESIDSNSTNASTKEVRVATVDNFQGEESKIIVCSLVRCNNDGNIGFLYEPERVNVLCSRARDGFIIFGSISTLLKSPRGEDTWKKILDYFENNNWIFSGLPTICQHHNTSNLLLSPEDFDDKCPDGGCLKPCGEIIQTCTSTVKHHCWRKCHASSDFHKYASCQSLVEVLCVNGHSLTRKCCSTEIPKCNEMINVRCARGIHTLKIKCGSNNKLPKCSKKFSTKCSNSHIITLCCNIDDSTKNSHCTICQESEKIAQNPHYEVELKSKEDELKSVQLEMEISKVEYYHKKEVNKIDAQIAESKKQRSMFIDLQNEDSSKDVTLPKNNENKNQQSIESKFSSLQLEEENNINLSSLIHLSSPPSPDSKKSPIITQRSSSDQIEKSVNSPPNSSNNQNTINSTNDLDISLESKSTSPLMKSEQNKNNLNIHNKYRNDQENHHQITALLNLVSLASQNEYFNLFTECEKYNPNTMIENITIECLKLFAEWKLEYHLEPHKRYEEITKSVKSPSTSETSKITSICNGVILYLSFFFNEFRTNIKSESILLHAWECRQLRSLKYEEFNSWRDKITVFIELTKKEGLQDISKQNTKKKSSSNKNTTALDKWKFCINKYLQSERKDDQDKTSPSSAVDDLMKMIGLESVKNEFITLYNLIEISNMRGSGHSSSYNIRFEGNPGTGKTTVARYYAEFLKEVGILSEECGFIETSGSKLMINGERKLEQQLEELKECGGGVIFVDEAYQLQPSTNQQGAQILNFIIPLAERLEGEYGKLVWIFAGYVDDMEKLFNFNVGLKSRFPTRFEFEDYTNDELELIFKKYLKNEPPVMKESNKSNKTKKSKEPKKSDNSSTIRNNLMNINRMQYGDIYGVVEGETRTDEWGNIWTVDLDNNRWCDEYGNINAFGPSSSSSSSSLYHRNNFGYYNNSNGKLGSISNPIINEKSGISWVYDDNKKQWYDLSNRTKVSNSYPGKPLPQIKKKIIPFHSEDEKWIRIAIRRLASRRNLKGFGNARDVRLLVDKCIQRQSDRISRSMNNNNNKYTSQPIDMYLLTRDDILGPKASLENLESCPEYQQLMKMQGVEQMKNMIKDILKMAIENSNREEREEPLLELSFNRVFLGNPGTGKTTIARLYGKILCSMGILSKGDTISKNPSDFIGDVIGSSESSTRAILAAAEGCVLVIDEAYMLNPNRSSGFGSGGTGDPFKTAVLDTLVEQVQGVPGDDRVVILLGYKKEMEDMFKNCNPGLSRRFQFDNPIIFEDYSDETLMKILKSKVLECGLTIDLKTSMFAIKELSRKRSLPFFGNAGEVNNILNEAKRNAANRRSNILCIDDFCKGGKLPVDGLVDKVMNHLIGNEDIDRLIDDYKNIINFAGKNAKNFIDYNFLFVGSPGTGKTTIARKMGEVFYHLNLLPTSDVIDISAKDLVTGYVGQSGKKTAEIFHNARGKVLFIDEAYQLNPSRGGSYMQEVVDEIVKALTSPEIVGNMVLILAGYEHDIDEMLTVNQGLRSRISKKIHFHNFNTEKVCELLQSNLKKKGLQLNLEAVEELPKQADILVSQPGFSNGRDIETLSKRIFTIALRERNNPLSISVEVLKLAFNKFLIEMGNTSQPTSIPSPPLQTMSASLFSSPPSLNTTQRTATTNKENEDIITINSEVEDINQKFLSSLQTILDERGLNSKEGIIKMVNLSDKEVEELAIELSERLNIDVDTMKEIIKEWQQSQRKMLCTLEEIEEMKKTKKRGRVPIWRCGVYGRDDKPYIVCYVAPYVVRYEERDLN